VVNDGYRLGAWPDICLFGDHGWYTVHRPLLALWPGLKVHCCKNDILNPSDGIKYLSRDRNHKVGLTDNPHRVAWGFNTGSSAINLAVHTGVRQIILLGFDMDWPGEKSHWHQGHGNGHRPRPNYAHWIEGLKVLAQDARRIGVEILNASPASAIGAFPKVSLREVL
jgi:hypothetical protein